MKLISPLTIDSTTLTSSTIAADEYIDSAGAIQTGTAWASGTTYDTGDIVLYENRVYESGIDSNTGNQPDENLTGSPAPWIGLGATNRYRMFDTVVGRASISASTDITVEVAPGEFTNGLALFNLTGTEVSIEMTDPADGLVYDETFYLISTENVIDAYTYFFEPFISQQNIVVTDLAPYPGATLEVSITGDDERAIGEMVIGSVIDIGSTEAAGSIGIQDYSVKQRDDFGNFTILERAFSKRGDFTVFLSNSIFGNVNRVLTERRAKPTVFIPTDSDTLQSPLLIYGFPKDFILEAAYPNYSLCTLEIEGLT